MKISTTISAVLFMLVAGCAKPPVPAAPDQAPLPFEKVSAKPGSPLSIDVWFETTPTAGAKTKIRARAVPSIACGEMTLTIRLPNGVTKTSGDDCLRCSPGANEAGELALECVIPDDAPRDIIASVTALLPDGTKFANACTLAVGKQRGTNGRRGKPSTNAGGEKIIEFPAR